jgi:hypothetical protein
MNNAEAIQVIIDIALKRRPHPKLTLLDAVELLETPAKKPAIKTVKKAAK